jgi:hypothetical protein
MSKEWFRLGLLIALMPMTLRAQAALDAQMCRNGLFADDDVAFSLAKVTGNAPLHFLDDASGCPEKGEADCQQKAYVLPGDPLVIGKHKGTFLCAFYPNRVGGSAGWIPGERVQSVAMDPAPPASQWKGVWIDGDDVIRITANGAALHAKGEAWWPSKNPPRDEIPGGPNLGSIDATAAPARNVVVFNDGACRVQATLLDGFLVVSDNRACGGMNVRFDGVYRRKP